MRVASVVRGSPAERAGIRSGDDLTSIDGRPVADSIDVTFALGWTDETKAGFELTRDGRTVTVELPVAPPDELGLVVEGPPTRICGNACVFCFVDQLPRGLRPSLYVKDEDYRLSFSFGNYITLTNLSDGDLKRIAEQRLSPLYVSVHATDDEVRRKMLGSEEAPAILDSLRGLADAGVSVHAQVVLCPGMNDGTVLDRTLADLHALGESILSVAVVPVGLTAHRDGLPVVEPVTADSASSALGTIGPWQDRFLADGRNRTVYAADEFYLLAGRALPPHEEYDDFPQLENGVGLLRDFEEDLLEKAGRLPEALPRPLAVALVTGELAAGFISKATEEALGRVSGLEIRVVAARNGLFGPGVTVAGLLSGRDMARALRETRAADLHLLPAVAFNVDGLTLDDMTLDDVAREAGRDSVVATDDLVGAILSATGGLREREEEGRQP